MNFINWLSQRRKAIAALVISELTVLIAYLQFVSAGAVTSQDWIILLIAQSGVIATTFGVHQASNTSSIQ